MIPGVTSATVPKANGRVYRLPLRLGEMGRYRNLPYVIIWALLTARWPGQHPPASLGGGAYPPGGGRGPGPGR